MQTAFLSTAGTVYLLDHKTGFTPAEFIVKESYLKNSIVQIDSSLGHFLALKKRMRPNLIEWDIKRVEHWIGSVGFDYCMKVVKYSRIDGARLSKIDLRFMRDTLGITDEN